MVHVFWTNHSKCFHICFFNFASDWLRGWCMFSGPITEQVLPYLFLQFCIWLAERVVWVFWTNHRVKWSKSKAISDYFWCSIKKCSNSRKWFPCFVFKSKRLLKASHERPHSCKGSVWSKLQRLVLVLLEFYLGRALFLCGEGEGRSLSKKCVTI